MPKLGRILIADDEEIILKTTAELLRRAEFQCDCATDAATAAEMLKGGDHDLLIADIKMPGNSNLEFIRELPKIAEGVPVILITGYPSLDTAIQSLELPVVAYMVKPFDFDELLDNVRVGVKKSKVLRTARRIRQLVQTWDDDISDVEQALKVSSPSSTSPAPIDAFLQLTFRNIVSTLSDLKNLSEVLAADKELKEACHLLNCPRHKVLKDALVETIRVLEKTKSAFRSKELGELRRKLELVLIGQTA